MRCCARYKAAASCISSGAGLRGRVVLLPFCRPIWARVKHSQSKQMKRLRLISSGAVIALGLALPPAAFAAHGGVGFGSYEGGFGAHEFAGHFGGGDHFGQFNGGRQFPHFGPYGGRAVYGPGGVFYGYDLGYGFGMAYPGYVTPSYCSQYPNGYMPSAGCYWPYTG
jgi:hypothetical protein